MHDHPKAGRTFMKDLLAFIATLALIAYLGALGWVLTSPLVG